MYFTRSAVMQNELLQGFRNLLRGGLLVVIFLHIEHLESLEVKIKKKNNIYSNMHSTKRGK